MTTTAVCTPVGDHFQCNFISTASYCGGPATFRKWSGAATASQLTGVQVTYQAQNIQIAPDPAATNFLNGNPFFATLTTGTDPWIALTTVNEIPLVTPDPDNPYIFAIQANFPAGPNLPTNHSVYIAITSNAAGFQPVFLSRFDIDTATGVVRQTTLRNDFMPPGTVPTLTVPALVFLAAIIALVGWTAVVKINAP